MHSMTHIAFDDELCPSSMLPVRMQNKWAPLVLRLLDRGDQSFNALRRDLPRIGPKELTRALRSLQHDGFVTRSPDGYGLTPLGRSLVEVLVHVYSWTAAHWDEIVDAREAGSTHELSQPKPIGVTNVDGTQIPTQLLR
ncbi:winged helix-turn-helix transcriptional regulator [Streptomyces fractus]|uniref:winged helix-turn-helix transcriptional regulator n=1 Tax=Streptomyces fractus TaxID=641806 RepID=UPI003CF92885